jgi:hypothetical protein
VGMDQSRLFLLQQELKLRHRHNDGSWSDLEPATEIHDPAQVDPERGWALGHLFRCRTCDEEVSVLVGDPVSDTH